VTTDKPHRRDLLPACVLDGGPEAVRQTEQTFRDALDTLDSTRQEARKAVEAAEAAPDADAQADLEAKRAGRKLPKPTLPDLERERDAAQRLVAVATQEAIAARDQRDAAIAAHRDELIAALGGRVADTATEAVDVLDRLPALFETLRVERSVLAALHRADRRWQTKLPGGGDVASLLAQLKTAVEAQARDTAPLRKRILAAVGDGPTTWDAVAEQLGVNKLDSDACTARTWLVEDGELAWVDQHGRPTAAAGQATPVFGRMLVKSTPEETPTQRARRERRERTAA
jgi:hypothetical protein